MEILQGLLPLLFVCLNFFLIINLIIFGRKIRNTLPLFLLLISLFISQVSELLICYFQINSQLFLFTFLAFTWISPIFVIAFVLQRTDLPKIVTIFYILAVFIFLTIVSNYGDINSECSFLALKTSYPSQWLWNYLSVIFLVIGAFRLNSSLKELSYKAEIKKNRILLYCIIATLIVTLAITFSVSDGRSYLESIIPKTMIFIEVGMMYTIIREKYNLQSK